MANSGSSLPCIPNITFTVSGKQHLLSTLDTNKASGPDHISPYILKHCAEEISPVLQIIYSQSLDSGSLPTDWLAAIVCPIHKKGSRTEPSNYRPISLTSVCSKVMEHIINHTIIEHLNSNNILINNQHDFRSQHSCVTQLIDLVEDLSFAMDHQRQVDVILLDFSKAFDNVPHQRLLKKLKYYGKSNNIYSWIETWLTRRSQCVVLNGISSHPVPVQSGVPQGTVLGPLMVLLYINDISKNIHSQLRLFADDCLLYRVINTEQDTLQLQQDHDLLSNWAETWQLKFNINKCTIMRFTRSTSPLTFNYQLNNQVLSTADQHLYLGVLLDKKIIIMVTIYISH